MRDGRNLQREFTSRRRSPSAVKRISVFDFLERHLVEDIVASLNEFPGTFRRYAFGVNFKVNIGGYIVNHFRDDFRLIAIPIRRRRAHLPINVRNVEGIGGRQLNFSDTEAAKSTGRHATNTTTSGESNRKMLDRLLNMALLRIRFAQPPQATFHSLPVELLIESCGDFWAIGNLAYALLPTIKIGMNPIMA